MGLDLVYAQVRSQLASGWFQLRDDDAMVRLAALQVHVERLALDDVGEDGLRPQVCACVCVCVCVCMCARVWTRARV